MNTSTVRINPDPAAIEVAFGEAQLRIVLSDGRERSAPLEWFPRLRDATSGQRSNWRLTGQIGSPGKPR